MVKVKSVHSEIGRSSDLYNVHSGMVRVKCVHSGISQIILALVCEQLDRPALLICNMAQWDGKS